MWKHAEVPLRRLFVSAHAFRSTSHLTMPTLASQLAAATHSSPRPRVRARLSSCPQGNASAEWIFSVGGNVYEKLDCHISVRDPWSDKFTYFNPRTKFNMNAFKAEYRTSLVRVLSTLPCFAGSPLKKHQCVLKHILTSNTHRKIQEFYSLKRRQHIESLLWYLLTGSEKWLSLNFLQFWKDIQNFQRQENFKQLSGWRTNVTLKGFIKLLLYKLQNLGFVRIYQTLIWGWGVGDPREDKGSKTRHQAIKINHFSTRSPE